MTKLAPAPRRGMRRSADPRHVDALDLDLVECLRLDGRQSNRSLATALGVNDATIASRLRRLKAARMVRVVALADFARLGFEFMAFALIETRSRAASDVGRELAAIPEVVTVAVTTGRFDLACGLLVTDRLALSRLVGERLPSVAGVAAVTCELAAEVERLDSRWAALDAAPAPASVLAVPTGVVDDVDSRLIGVLQRDARVSNRVLAARVGVSEGTVRQRLRRLEEDRLIQICAVSDLAAFGHGSGALVGVQAVGGQVDELVAILSSMRSIGLVVRSVGQFAILLAVAAPSRLDLFDVVVRQIQGLPQVRRTELLEIAWTLKHDAAWTRLLN